MGPNMGMRENSVSICLSKKTVIVLFYSYRFTGLWEESEVPTSTFLTLIVFEGFGRSRKYPHESASKLLVHAASVFELARPLSLSELFAYRTCKGPSVDNVVQL